MLLEAICICTAIAVVVWLVLEFPPGGRAGRVMFWILVPTIVVGWVWTILWLAGK